MLRPARAGCIELLTLRAGRIEPSGTSRKDCPGLVRGRNQMEKNCD